MLSQTDKLPFGRPITTLAPLSRTLGVSTFLRSYQDCFRISLKERQATALIAGVKLSCMKDPEPRGFVRLPSSPSSYCRSLHSTAVVGELVLENRQ
jgi:hypothetical protein